MDNGHLADLRSLQATRCHEWVDASNIGGYTRKPTIFGSAIYMYDLTTRTAWKVFTSTMLPSVDDRETRRRTPRREAPLSCRYRSGAVVCTVAALGVAPVAGDGGDGMRRSEDAGMRIG